MLVQRIGFHRSTFAKETTPLMNQRGGENDDDIARLR
jgi:hypothetical protein